MIIQQLENDYLAVTVHADAAADIVDKSTGARWRMGRVALQEDGPIDVGHVWLRSGRSICEQYPGRFAGTADGADIVYTLHGREGRVMGQFRCQYELDGPWLSCRIIEIEEALETLVFPPPIESESLVIPMGVGKWIKKPLAERKYWTYPAHINMRWFGGLRGENGWIGVFDEGYCDSGVLAAEMTVTSAWLKSLGTWTGPRAVKYRFGDGGYVGLARAYRAYAIENGLHKSLDEKMEAFPGTRNMLGGRILSFYQARGGHPEFLEDRLQKVSHDSDAGTASGTDIRITHAQIAQFTEEAKALGMKRGLVNIRGWINGGYDESHPDIWPPEPGLGSVEELKQLLAMPDPFTSVLHDNYQDIYERAVSWPNGVMQTRNGHRMPGGFWAGGQCYLLNSRDGLAYAKRNWKEIAGLEPRGMFIDTTIAVQLYESFEAGNTLTRAEDMAYKLDLLWFYREQGQSLGSEEGADFGVPVVDWIENRHARVAGESIPLWPLVFHDAAFCTRYSNPMGGQTGGARQWLTDMLWGYMLLWGAWDVDAWAKHRDGLAASGHVDAWHGRIGADDLVSHRYLTEDCEVEETVFASGAAIVANFASEERQADGVTVPAGGYVIRD